MGKVFDTISDELRTFIMAQHVFFVSTAPLSGDGHVNLSPKGMDCLRVFSPTTVGYLDLTGSGNETSAHIAENGRITFMFCAFEGAPNITRLYGHGRVILPDTPEWATWSPHFTQYIGTRQIILAEIHRVQTSCGYAVPFMDYREERETLQKYWEVKRDQVAQYQADKNQVSIDGLPAPLSTRVTR